MPRQPKSFGLPVFGKFTVAKNDNTDIIIDEPIQIDYEPDHLEYEYVPLSSTNTPYHIQKEQRLNFYIDNREEIHHQLNIYNYAIGS